MNPAATAKSALSLLALLALSTAAPLHAREPRTDPGEDPRAILRANHAASGGAAWDAVRLTHVTVSVAVGGLDGQAEAWEELLTGRVTSRYRIGPMKGGEGYDGKVSWQEDDSGEVTEQEGPEEAEERATRIYRQALAFWYPERGEAALSHEGVKEEGGRSFDVVRVAPKGGRAFDLWIDRATRLLDRTVETTAAELRTTYVSDYREVSGVKVPFRTRIGNGEEKYDQTLTVTAFEVNPPAAETTFLRPKGGAGDFGIAGGKGSFTSPFRLVNNHIYIDVSFDGRPAIPVLFDTGGLNALVPAVVERYGLKAEGSFQMRGSGEGSEDVALTRVGEIRIGDAYLKDQGFFVFPLQGLDKVEGVPVNGLIGYEVFKRFVVRLDYQRREATFFLPRAFAPDAGAAAVPFTFDDRTPQIEGEIDGLRGRFTVDSGSRASLTLNRPFAEKNGLQAKYGARHEAMSGWGVGGGVRSRFARGGMLKMGTVEVPSPLLDLSLNEKGAFANPYLAGNIGAGVLKRFTVTFDYGHQKIYLAPNESFAKPEGADRSGLWLNLAAGDGYRVEEVVPGSPAAEAGLAVGDTIVKVGDQAAASLLLSDFRQRLREEGAPVALTIRKADGTTREVSLVLRDLV